MRISFVVVTASLASLAAIAAACSSGSSGGTGNSTLSVADMACQGKTDCETCCENNHKQGAQVANNALIACVCDGKGDGGSAPCADACAASLCVGKEEDTDCSACAERNASIMTTCQNAAVRACNTNADCSAEQACTNACSSGSAGQDGDGGQDSGKGQDSGGEQDGGGGQNDCANQCTAQHEDGVNAFIRILGECACVGEGLANGAPLPCQTECGDNWCAGENGTDACAACIYSDATIQTCNAALTASCKPGSPDGDSCDAWISCLNNCQ